MYKEFREKCVTTRQLYKNEELLFTRYT